MILPFDVISTIICDDIRREWNGKDILIGVYGSGIKLSAMPSTLVLWIWLETRINQVGVIPLRLRITDGNDNPIFEQQMLDINVVAMEDANISFGGIPVTITSPGPMKIYLASTADWQLIKTINVTHGEITHSSLR